VDLVILVIAVAAIASTVLVVQHNLNKRLAVIHDLVNSNLTRVTADLKVAEQRIETLEQSIAHGGARG
jgi:hypothetical protein